MVQPKDPFPIHEPAFAQQQGQSQWYPNLVREWARSRMRSRRAVRSFTRIFRYQAARRKWARRQARAQLTEKLSQTHWTSTCRLVGFRFFSQGLRQHILVERQGETSMKLPPSEFPTHIKHPFSTVVYVKQCVRITGITYCGPHRRVD